MALFRTAPTGGAFHRRFTDYSGLFFDEFSPESAWIREEGHVRLPPLDGIDALVVTGDYLPHPEAHGIEQGSPGLVCFVNGLPAARLPPPAPGPWELRVPLAPAAHTEHPVLDLRLTGTGGTNFLAWLGRVTGAAFWHRFRAQNKNRQLRIRRIATEAGETVYDFSLRDAPFSRAFARRHARLGLNIVGFLTADLGIGESARCMIRAADAAKIPTALVPLKLHCRNPLGDLTYASRLQETNPYGVNVVHVDPPASRDLDHHHGAAFRAGKYNIGYFAWELPDFPDAWVPSFDFYDEIWCPSDFVREAVAAKAPVPVLTMPHAVGFARPAGSCEQWRARFHLPESAFIFLTLFDLNSYAERKNPQAALAAFRQSGRGEQGDLLVVKVHNAAANAGDLAALEAAARSQPGVILITATLSRPDTYALEAACDALVSLHRAEGFGLVVAECMYLGRPVIATNWSATAEFLGPANGCPVRCTPVVLERNYGPYTRGSTWAEPDVVHAAEWMQRLAGDRALGLRLGQSARATIEARFAPAVIGARYRQRLEAISTF
jgi:glycosyltransferase involved in cell wall biosynthesis